MHQWLQRFSVVSLRQAVSGVFHLHFRFPQISLPLPHLFHLFLVLPHLFSEFPPISELRFLVLESCQNYLFCDWLSFLLAYYIKE